MSVEAQHSLTCVQLTFSLESSWTPSQHSLTFYSLSNNDIGDVGTCALAGALQEIWSLLELEWVQPFMLYLLSGVYRDCSVVPWYIGEDIDTQLQICPRMYVGILLECMGKTFTYLCIIICVEIKLDFLNPLFFVLWHSTASVRRKSQEKHLEKLYEWTRVFGS